MPLYQYQHSTITRLEMRLRYYLKGNVSLIITDNSRSIIYAKQLDHAYTIRLHHMFLEANEDVIRALAHYLSGKHRQNNKSLNQFIKANEWKIIKPLKYAKTRKVKIRVQGDYFNLLNSFRALNHKYFNNCIDCSISWGPVRKTPIRKGPFQKKTKQKSVRLGSYSFRTLTIRINPLLDKPFVPQYVIDSIIYHEMLHHYLGGQEKNGRRLSHHPSFKAAEKRFSHHIQAKLWIEKNLLKLLR